MFKFLGLKAGFLVFLFGTAVSATEVSMVGRPDLDYDVTQYYSPVAYETEVHVIGVYEAKNSKTLAPQELQEAEDKKPLWEWWLKNVRGTHPTFPSKVRVAYEGTEPMQPITLVLSSYEPIDWEFDIDDGAQIEQIILNGYHEQAALNVGDIPVTNYSPHDAPGLVPCAYTWPIDSQGCDTPGLVSAVEEIVGTPITSFSGTYESNSITITGSPVGSVVDRPRPGAGNLEDGPSPDLIYNQLTGAVTIDLTDLPDDPLGIGHDLSVFQRLHFVLSNYPGSFSSDALDLDTLNPIGIPDFVRATESSINLNGVLTRLLPDPESVELGTIFPAGLQDPLELQQYLSSAAFDTGFQSGDFDLIVVSEQSEPSSAAAISLLDIIDSVCSEIASGGENRGLDFTNDGLIDRSDLALVLSSQNASAGDTNLDGVVQFDDFLVLSENFGSTDAFWTHGDSNCDGEVSFPDFLAMWENYESETAGTVAVPEAANLSSLLLGVGTLFFLARSRRSTRS